MGADPFAPGSAGRGCRRRHGEVHPLASRPRRQATDRPGLNPHRRKHCLQAQAVGDAAGIGLEEARRQATELLAAIRRDETPALAEDRLFETVAEEVFARYGRHWKPGTMKVNCKYLRNTILPRFRGRNIADITKQDVQLWLASLRATPVAADRSAPILSVIMRQAELYGYREGRLFLRESKTGPRTVWLSSPARTVLDGLPRKGR